MLLAGVAWGGDLDDLAKPHDGRSMRSTSTALDENGGYHFNLVGEGNEELDLQRLSDRMRELTEAWEYDAVGGLTPRWDGVFLATGDGQVQHVDEGVPDFVKEHEHHGPRHQLPKVVCVARSRRERVSLVISERACDLFVPLCD